MTASTSNAGDRKRAEPNHEVSPRSSCPTDGIRDASGPDLIRLFQETVDRVASLRHRIASLRNRCGAPAQDAKITIDISRAVGSPTPIDAGEAADS